jgi:hypothetical protein
MPRCANKLCRTKLAKGTKPPLVCNDSCRDHAIQQALHKKREADKRAQARARNLVEREAKAERRALRARKQRSQENDHKWQTARTQDVFNEFIRLLDRDRPCISCQRDECGHIFDCGHFKTVAAFPQLRFDPRNAFKQGSNCNRPHERRQGNQASVTDGFYRGILERFGEDHLLFLGGYHPPKNYSCGDLADLRAMFAAEVKRLKKGLPASKNWREINQSARLDGAQVEDAAA